MKIKIERERAKLIPIIDELELLQKIENDKLDSARSMLAAGLSAAEISKHLKLSIEVIENLS